MMINIYIDNNVWNFLFDRNIRLKKEFPRDCFCLCMTREAEFEIPPIKNPKLRAFIDQTVEECVTTESYFGFYDESVPNDEQRNGGFNEGGFISLAEYQFLEQQKRKLGDIKPKTKLRKNEADIALATRSIQSIVLTLDAKKGPINDAYKKGGNVIYLTEFDKSGLTLAEFVKNKLNFKSSNELSTASE